MLNTLGPVAAGLGIGICSFTAVASVWPSNAEKTRHAEHGHELLGADDVLAKVAPLGIALAAGVWAGCVRKTSSTPGSIASVVIGGGAALFASSGASTLVNSNGNGRPYLAAMGLMAGLGMAGCGVGRYAPHIVGRSVALAATTATLGVALPAGAMWTLDSVRDSADSARHE